MLSSLLHSTVINTHSTCNRRILGTYCDEKKTCQQCCKILLPVIFKCNINASCLTNHRANRCTSWETHCLWWFTFQNSYKDWSPQITSKLASKNVTRKVTFHAPTWFQKPNTQLMTYANIHPWLQNRRSDTCYNVASTFENFSLPTHSHSILNQATSNVSICCQWSGS